MIVRPTVATTLLLLAAPVAGQQAIAQPTTVQQDFEAATRLMNSGDNAGAVALWTKLEGRTAGNPRSRAIVLVRKSIALLALDRRDDAVAAARAGLKGLPESDPSLRRDRYQAHFNLGRIASSSLDYATAVDEFARAEALADEPLDKYVAQFGLVETQLFLDPKAAAAALGRLEATSATMKVDPKAAARQRQLHAALALNTGDLAGAMREAKISVDLLGGLTPRTDLYDVSARSDAALAFLLANKPDEARRYMAMTGAGRLPDGQFEPGVQMVAPPCGGDADLKPDDMAVIEFSVDADGGVTNSRPVYAAGGGRVALEFARVARRWSWTADQAKALPPFFRSAVRIEMRCTTAFERPSVGQLMVGELERWLIERGVASAESATVGDARTLSAQRAQVAAATKPDASAIAARLRLLLNLALPREERAAVAAQTLGDLERLDAPAAVRLPVEMMIRRARISEARIGDGVRIARPLLTTEPYGHDPLSRAYLQVYIADSLGPRQADAARALLQGVVDSAGLPAKSDLKIGALIRLASLAQQAGAVADARAAFEKSGLDASQCAILDAPPKQLSVGGTFPMEASRWGFEGWTQVEYDITADGKVRAPRVLMAYPPFIFSKAGAATLASARYTPSYRPDGGLGCGAQTGRVRFLLGR